MSSISQLPDQKARYDEASLWIAKMDRVLTSQEQEELAAWMNENQENSQLLLGMAEQWDKMDALSRLSSMFPHSLSESDNPPGSYQGVTEKLRLLANPAIAASLLALFVIGFVLLPDSSSISESPKELVSYETAVGEQSSIMLPDGSHMRLNTDTLVQVSYSPEERLLDLIRGELNIEVAHDSERPLRVQANGRVVEAVGTEFNVEITSQQEVELVVTNGKVIVTLVDPQENAASEPALQEASSDPIEISRPIAVSAGEEILLGSSEQTLKKILPEETLVKLSWHRGNLIFGGESLEDAMAEVGRYTPIEFVFLDEEAKQVRIAGLFKAGDTTTLLSILRENFNVTYEWVDSEKVLLSSL